MSPPPLGHAGVLVRRRRGGGSARARRLASFAVLWGSCASLSTMAPARTVLDAASLRNAALARAAGAAGGYDAGLLWLEHVNIVVGDRSAAERFYFEDGLGCGRDPAKPGGEGTSGTMWANLGRQQFHLAEEAADDPRQVVRGAIGLCLPDCAAAAARLAALPKEDGVAVAVHAPDRFTATCPTGNVFHCYEAGGAAPAPDGGYPTKMAALHRADDGYGGSSLAVGGGPGIRYLHFLVDDGFAAAHAYADEFGTPVTGGDGACAAPCGLGPVHLLFETAPPDAVAAERQEGVHLCVYVDDFATRYDRLRPHVFTNPRFKHLDTCDTLDEARASRTFRFAFPEVPNLEHETRDLTHVQFLKQIHYEPR